MVNMSVVCFTSFWIKKCAWSCSCQFNSFSPQAHILSPRTVLSFHWELQRSEAGRKFCDRGGKNPLGIWPAPEIYHNKLKQRSLGAMCWVVVRTVTCVLGCPGVIGLCLEEKKGNLYASWTGEIASYMAISMQLFWWNRKRHCMLQRHSERA